MSVIVKEYATIYSLFVTATAVHVSGGISTYYQQLITLYLQYLALMRTCTPKPVPIQPRSQHVAVTVSLMPGTVDTVL